MKSKLFLLVLFPITLLAQKGVIKRAEKEFDNQSYISAIKIYEALAEEGTGSEQVYEKLGDANYFNAYYTEAQKWYDKRYGIKTQYPKEFFYRYAQSLKSSGREEEAAEMMAIYAKENPSEIRVLKLANKDAVQKTIKKGSANFTVSLLNINSKFSDYSSTIKGDTLFFASARPQSSNSAIYARTGQPFTNLYYAKRKGNSTYDEPKMYSREVFSVFHESSPVFSPDGKSMYYTQNELKKNSKEKVVNGLYKIYKSQLVKGKWKSLGVQNIFAMETARVAHPAISPDGKTLFFASDAKGSYGQSDIYKVTINEDGSYSTPKNLGDKVNSESRESYPFVTKDNILLFASDINSGMGGLDIYALDLNQPGAYPVHLPSPLNSRFDDFGIYWDREIGQGVFTSNRQGGEGDDDLYSFVNDRSNPFGFDYDATIKGQILDKENNKPIPKATVILFEGENEVARTTTDASGNYVFTKTKPNVKYRIQAGSLTHGSNESVSSIPLYEKQMNTDVVLTKDIYKITNGLDLAKVLEIKNIYFDIAKAEIKYEARVELEKVYQALKMYPNIKIRIGAYTDSRQSKEFNQQLSQKRANVTMNYLIKKGINRNRLSAVGYGETQLVNDCSDGVECSEEEHALNRRSTFVIISK